MRITIEIEEPEDISHILGAGFTVKEKVLWLTEPALNDIKADLEGDGFNVKITEVAAATR